MLYILIPALKSLKILTIYKHTTTSQVHRSVVKTTSATSEASRLFDQEFFGVKTVVLPEK